MSSIDRRVVEAKFDNRQFQEGVKSTLGSLDSLNKGLKMEGAASGLSNVSGSASKVAHSFNAMRIAAGTAVATVAYQATVAAERFVKSFTIAPIMQGLDIYQTKLNSIQTVLANTGLKGKAGLAQVNGALADLNKYSNQTIYNFSEMARNVGTFTAAGVGLDKSVSAIKGIANLAAISGSNSQQASTAMYQLSQALAAGRVKLQDWNSVVNAGMGGKVFQNALMETARVHGVAIDKMVKKQGGFRNTLQEGWLTSKILTQTLAKFTGDLSDKQLKAQGYTAKQIKQIQELGKTAIESATKVKTLPQLMDVLKESVATGWATSFELIIGNLSEAKSLFTGINNAVGGFITQSANARNKILGDWKALGGRTVLIDAIKQAFKDLGAILKPIHDAFREIFPKTTGKELYALTIAIRTFFDNFKIGAETADALKRTFAGVFAVFDIGWQIVKNLARFLFDLAAGASKGTGGILKATASIGDFLVRIDNMLKKGDAIHKFFMAIANLPFVTFLGELVSHFYNVTSTVALLGPSLNKALSIIQSIGKALKPIGDAVASFFKHLFTNFNLGNLLQIFNLAFVGGIVLLIKKMVDRLKGGGDGATGMIQGLVDKITAPFTKLTATLKQMQQTLRVATLIEIALAIGIMTTSVLILSKINSAALTKAVTALGGMFAELLGATYVFTKVGGAKGLASTATGLILFATAIRILASAVKTMAGLSWGQLAKGLAGVTGLIGGLVAASRGMAAEAGGMIRSGAGLILLAEAVKVLVKAVAEMAKLSWGQISKGLTGVAVTLAALALFTKFAETDKMGVLSGAGLILLAAGLKLLAEAVSSFAKESWGQLAKGLVSVGALLAEFAIFSKSVGNPVTLLASSAALVGIGIAMNILAKAMQSFAKMSWGQIAKGLVSMAGALTLVVLALNAMPVTSVLSAAALVGVSIALVGIGHAVKSMGGMSWGEIAKGLVTLAGSLIIISAALYTMEGALPGAAAMWVVAAALAIFVPELKILGGMSWGSIGKGLVALAGAFAVIGVAGLLLTPVIPSLVGLGGAILLLGAGVAAIGGGVFLFATGLTAIATAGASASSALQLIFKTVLGFFPELAKAFGQVLVELSKAVSTAAPQLLKTAITLITMMLKAIEKEGPKIIDTFSHLLVHLTSKLADSIPKIAKNALKMFIGILDAVDKAAPRIVDRVAKLIVDILNALASHVSKIVAAGMNLIIHFLEGIAKNVPKVEKAGADIIIAYIKGIGKQAIRIVNAALDTVIAFANGLAKAINSHVGAFRAAGLNIAMAIANGMTMGLAGKAKDVAESAINVAKGAVGGVAHFLHIKSPSRVFYNLGWWSGTGFANGLDDTAKKAKAAGQHVAKSALDGATKEFRDAAKYISNQMPKDLVGGRDQVRQTIKNTSDLLHNAVQRAHQDMQQANQDLKQLKNSRDQDARAVKDAAQNVEDQRVKLEKLTSAKKQDTNAIKQAQRALDDAKAKLKEATKAQKDHADQIVKDTAALAEATKEYGRAKAAQDAFKDSMDKEKQKLIDLSKQYDQYTAKIDAAKQALQDAINTRDQYNKSISDQYSALPDITDTTTVEDYTGTLGDQVKNTQSFIDDLNQLRDQFHLSDDLYKELLSKGPAILPFVEQLVSGGQAAVDQLNTLSAQLDAEAASLGKTASASLYQAGVDTAQGLLDGLEKQRHAIIVKMEKIAKDIERTLKRKLKIKSPSEIMHEAGVNLMEGLNNGIESSRQKLMNTVDRIGQAIVNRMREYVAEANDLASGVSTKTIRPVIDTSKAVPKQSTAPKISTTATTQAASGVSVTFGALAALKESISQASAGTTQNVTFVQNNTSPKALSAAEIYRQTKNQISVAKGALATNVA